MRAVKCGRAAAEEAEAEAEAVAAARAARSTAWAAAEAVAAAWAARAAAARCRRRRRHDHVAPLVEGVLEGRPEDGRLVLAHARARPHLLRVSDSLRAPSRGRRVC